MTLQAPQDAGMPAAVVKAEPEASPEHTEAAAAEPREAAAACPSGAEGPSSSPPSPQRAVPHDSTHPTDAAATAAAPSSDEPDAQAANGQNDVKTPDEPDSPQHGRWPKKVKAGRALLEVTQDMLERSQKLPILLHWRWTGKSINAMYLYQKHIFQGYVGTATCDVAIDMEVDPVGAPPADDDAAERPPFANGADASSDPGPDDVCALCGQGESKSRSMLSEAEARLDPGHLIRANDGSKSCWVHSKCAQYTQEVAIVASNLEQEGMEGGWERQQGELHQALTQAIRSSKYRVCALCQEPHATLRCCFCSKAFHYRCSVQANCCVDPFEPHRFTCRVHAHRMAEMMEADMMPMQPVFPSSMTALMNMRAAQQRANDESNSGAQSSSDDEESESSQRHGHASSGGNLEARSHLQPDSLAAMVAPHMRAADHMMYGGMRQMTLMDPHMRMQGPQGLALGQPGGLQPATDDQGEWCYDRFLGGTTGHKGRHGRCSVCLVQRKGRCGTESAPNSCIRVQAYLSQGKVVPSAPPKQTRKRAHQFVDNEDYSPPAQG